jgi:EAL domain-containing protein (putative c-di-GMP-specific phosphodiesterase class I)/GGDEF domain-containing protein
MPSLSKLHIADHADQIAPSSSERFTRALVALTRRVWDPDCTFESAIGAISETAAAALQVDRVSVWHYEPDAGQLRCLNAYHARDDAHVHSDALETLSLDGDDYMAALRDVRTFDVTEVEADPGTAGSHSALRDYLHRHRIHALLDAPAFIAGEMQGVICHESIDRSRAWSQEEITFAASMGDYVAMAYEIVRRRRAESEVEHLRLHDATTDLPNRDYMVELVAQRLVTPRTPGETLAIVHVRIDATSGLALSADAPTVDDVMGQLAQRLRRFTSHDIDLARVRSDGFAFALAHAGAQGAVVRLAERCLGAVRAVEWHHEEIDPGAAAGVAFADAVAYTDARVLMRQAEEAAERAHASGDKYAYEVFDLDHHDALVERLRFERALRDAFANDDFELHYQPEYDAAEHQWVAAEALLRWRNGDRLVNAAEFIDVAESSGLILPLGSWVLHRACSHAAQWPSRPDGSYPTLRVNVSPRQFDEGNLVEDVAAALNRSGLAPGRLCVEITETALMGDFQHAWKVLQQLKERGVQVAIDDFGTGYASLVYLKRFPVDVLKIDRSFVEGMPSDPADTAIVAAVVGLAGSLGIDVVAEGVERIEQQHALQAIGVQRMQGWLYARAMDHASACQLLATPFD